MHLTPTQYKGAEHLITNERHKVVQRRNSLDNQATQEGVKHLTANTNCKVVQN